MPQSTYELVTQQVTVPADTNGQPNTYTLAAPTGKKPLAGGYQDSVTGGNGEVRLTGSYPSGSTWVFKIVGASSQHTVDLYLVTAEV